MARDISPEEARDEKLDELNNKHYLLLRHKLRTGDEQLADAVEEAISVHIDEAFWRSVVISASYGHASLIGNRFVKLAENALGAMAESEALRELEQLERERAESQDDNRVARAEFDRAIDE